MRLLACTLLHFLWQGLVLAAVFAALMAGLRSAASRYAAAVFVLLLMVAAPFATFFFLRQSPISAAPALTTIVPTAAHTMAAATPATPADAQSIQGISPDTFDWLVRVWMIGVIVLSLRTAGGMLIVERLQRRKASPVTARLLETCLALQASIGIARRIRYVQCHGLDVPAVIGWFRPVVLLPMTVLTGLSQAQLEAVLIHELAHIKRCDYFVNLFQIAAETLLFYHPAVWWVSRSIRQERENCCDDAAVALCGNAVEYARALTYMEGGRTAPSLVMAASGSPLKMRVLRLLGRKKSGDRILSTGLTIGAVCLAVGLFVSQPLLRVAHASSKRVPVGAADAQATSTPAQPDAFTRANPAVAPTHPTPPSHVVPVAPPAPASPVIAALPVLHAATPPMPAVADTVAATPSLPPTQETPPSPSVGTSYIDSMRAAGFDHLSVDDLVAMKIQGVTADYVRQIHDLGLKPSPDDLVAMRIQGVTPEYVRDMRAAGVGGNTDDLIAMKIQGVTPEYIRAVRDLGLKADADDLVAMRIQQVTPEYIRAIRALGLNPGTDDLIAMRIQGVTPEYAKALSAAGLPKLNADDLISAKIQGITPDFIEKARQHGFQGLDLEQLIALKHAGVL
jgi:beta-lactamase regulating signal transducer with metallopeptidase domain